MSSDPAAHLADRLLDTHRRICSLESSDAEKARLARRLMALSDTAKVDLDSAARRLDRLIADLEEGAALSAGGDREPG